MANSLTLITLGKEDAKNPNRRAEEALAGDKDTAEPQILLERQGGMVGLILNRPRALNALNLEMIRGLQGGLHAARGDEGSKLVLLRGAGERGFCAGGDLKALGKLVREKSWDRAVRFFQEEYALDLDIHRFPKPVIALAAGVTMGGGLGLAAGADLVVVTENSRLAMPETSIGFFPDVGATGWLFAKCPSGYPEYLALTGVEMTGPEAVRLGLATHLLEAAKIPEVLKMFKEGAGNLSPAKDEAVRRLRESLDPWANQKILPRPELDAWVARHFANKTSVQEILDSLKRCRDHPRLDPEVGKRLQARSPTALVLTLRLLHLNQGRPLEEVLAAEGRAARFMIAHPDYLEGIRARLLDRNQRPRWQPAALQEVRLAWNF